MSSAIKTNYIKVKTQFEGCHRWIDAPDQVKFLRNFHRHDFFVVVTIEVKKINREIEFFCIKHIVDKIIKKEFGFYFEDSCEQIANTIAEKLFKYLDGFHTVQVYVSEDNINGGGVVWEAK